MGIEAFNSRTSVIESVAELFDTMLSMTVKVVEDREWELSETDSQISGALSFAGEIHGGINIQITQDFSREMTAAMLGMDVEEIESDEEVKDVLLEV
ncbi:MAG: hypothetical protein GY859_33985, partial [Desulfobacterales bacterium]|nr:hypothetical protein [Desulfobacterales bacterium]